MHIPRCRLSYSTLLYIIAVPFTLAFTAKAMQIHGVFGTAGYDMGIADQTVWLLSRFEPAFSTVRGLHSFGDHFRPIEYVFVPLYWIYPSVVWLFLVQVLSVTVGGIVLYRVGEIITGDRHFLSFAFALSFYLNPVVHNTLLWHYHDFVLTTGLSVILVHSYMKNRLRAYVVTLFLLLLCREDVGIILVAFGALALLHKRWNYGWITIVASFIWVTVVFLWVMPYLNGEAYYRHYAGSLSTPWARLFDWEYHVHRIFLAADSRQYVWLIFYPLLFIPVLGPEFLIPAAPSILVNTLIGSYNTQIGYHYSAMTMPFVYTAALVGVNRILGRARSTAAKRRTACVIGIAVLLVGIYAFQQHSALHPEVAGESYRWWVSKGKVRADVARLNRTMGVDAGVAASDFYAPHFTHRKKIYLFPNPWKVHYWGIHGENPHHPNEVDYIVVTPEQFHKHSSLLFYLKRAGFFKEIMASRDMIVLQRIRPEDPDRDRAVEEIARFYQNSGEIRFTNIRVSPMFPGGGAAFGLVHIDPSTCAGESWQPIQPAKDLSLKVDFNEVLAGGGVGSAYVCVDIESDSAQVLSLLLGSDDGLTVWVNGEKVLEKLVARIARLGDDRIEMELRKGRNRLVFRVNNIGGAWRLLAQIN